MQKPATKPQNPCFSSGPCAKRPGWSLAALDASMAGRSHRAGPAKAQLKAVIDKHRALLGIPADWRLGIVPASDTGAVEMALWGLLGPRGVDVCAWESFSGDWLKDITGQLKLPDVRAFEADYGALPDLSQVNPDRDLVFAWNGTTSGVRVPNGDWISATRHGLAICDATSAVFAYDLPWDRLDVVTWSWQKVLGSEGAHGMLALSPRAAERLATYTPPWPMPKIFRLATKGALDEVVFEGSTINTPSMIAVADCLDALAWVESIGGLKTTIARAEANARVLWDWVEATPWAEHLAVDPTTRSVTTVCLRLPGLSEEQVKAMVKLLDAEKVAHDIAAYRAAPPGLRIWCGATVEAADLRALLPWLAWARAQVI